jgi:hypothetical protein
MVQFKETAYPLSGAVYPIIGLKGDMPRDVLETGTPNIDMQLISLHAVA